MPFSRRSFALNLLLSICAFPKPADAQTHGLTTRPVVAPYLDGALPTQPPTLSGNWSAVVAFPNLNFLNPTGLAPMPGTTKLVVWEREGRVYQFENVSNVATKTLVLDVSAQCQGWDDSGLLGLAFHPNFVTNRHVYLWYSWKTPGTVIGNPNTRPPTFTPGRNRLSRFTLDANGVALAGSEFVIIDQADESVWHNGGGMFFHPTNGFLYITNGDDAVGSNNQRIDAKLMSGVLRIDVDKRGGAISHAPPRRATNEVSQNWPAHFIPNDNPFVGVANAREEFFAIGLRSPHRMTIDPVTERIFIGDVGGGSWEEISVIEPNDPPGLNFQWDRIEGSNGDLTGNYIGVNKPPIIDYSHSEGGAVIGGYVYRGQQFAAELGGRYIFGDNIANVIWVLDESTTPATKTVLTSFPRGPGPNSGNDYIGLSSFGLDASGELYMCQMSSGDGSGNAGKIFKLQRGGTVSRAFPSRLSQTGAFSDLLNLTPSNKLIPYDLNAPFFSDNAIKSRWAVVPSDSSVQFAPTGEWSFPTGSVFVKHFDLSASETNPLLRKRLETRLLVKTATGVFGATYKWRADNSDADLLDSAFTENVPVSISPLGNLTPNDVGSPTSAGSTTRNGDAVTITAGGTDIWNASDQFHFAHQQRTGDFDVHVRAESITQADLYTKSGLMARESLAPGSRHVMALVFPSNAARNNNVGGYEFQYRAATGGTSTALYPPAPQARVNFPNTWLRLKREGDTFIAYSSLDGAAWQEFSRTTLALPQTLFFGIAVTAHTATATTTAKFHLQTNRLQPWYYPSRQDCVTCHTQQSTGVLGLKTRQLNKPMLYPNGVTENQLLAWKNIDLFSNPPADPSVPTFDRLAHHTETTATLEKRARSYLDANCSSCHRPNSARAFWDARFDTPLAEQGLLYGRVGNTLGIPDAKVITPQDLSRSILYHRVNTVGPDRMPPIARTQIDRAGTALLADWINSLTPNTAPVVALTNPADNSIFTRGADIPLAATASDSDGITRIEFYANATKVGEANAAPYSVTWQDAPRGIFAVTAIAFDGIGNSKVSTARSVSVQNPPGAFEANINFQLGTAQVPTGYEKDDGGPYATRANGLSYGWSRDNRADARERNSGNAPDKRYDTLVHMQKPHNDGSNTSYWELAVPNGRYEVLLVVGDPTAPDSYQEVTAEGQTIVSGIVDGGTPFRQGLITVNVADGRLRLAPGAAGVGTKLCFTEIARVPVLPTVSLTGLTAGTAFLAGESVSLTANAADSDGTVARVEFYVGAQELGEDTTSPYGFSWNGPLPVGTHLVRAVAIDNDGNTKSSTALEIKVLAFEMNALAATRDGANVRTRLGSTLPSGRQFVIECSETIEDPAGWTTVHSSTSNGLPFEFEHSAADTPRRFYRLRLIP